MTRTIASVLVLFVLAIQPQSAVSVQSSPDSFPLTAGTYWVYEGRSRWQADDGSIQSARRRWRMEVPQTIDRGDVTVAVAKGFPGDDASERDEREPREYLIVKTASKDYFFVDGATPDEVFNASSSPEALSDLLTKKDEFFALDFPLSPGKTYAQDDPANTRTDTMYAWHVESRRKARLNGVRGVSRSRSVTTYRIAYRIQSDDTVVEFVPGIGITRFIYSHHGSVSDVDARLVEFHRAVAASGS
jgi:hypothetical protein